MHLRIAIILLLLFIVSGGAYTKDDPDTKYWIIFTDKGAFKPDADMSPGSKAYEAAVKLISERALERRKKVLPENALLTYQDLPLEQSYIKSIKDLKIDLIAESKWLNGVSAYMTQSQLESARSLPFVKKISLVQKLYKQEFDTESVITPGSSQDYGNSFKQMELVNVPKVHDLGITGEGVLIACFDDGFDWKNHEALRDLKVLEEYDFINEDPRTYYEEGQTYKDRRNQGQHGTAVVSTMSGFRQGKLVGPAYGSELLLAKTEYIPTETPMEEDFWLEATEWAEALGADIITSSLIYKAYDDPYGNNSYTYNDLDGKTAITSFAASTAARLGIVVCQAMGNYFQTTTPSLGSAADADSIISVGAIAPNGSPANFTSNGPTSDGRTKPDVSAPGVMVYAAVVKEVSGDDSTYEYTSGTSFATPITAGICALILSAHPELTPIQVREALRNTASKSTSPDNILGWGIVNAYDALLYHGMAFSNNAVFSGSGSSKKVSIKLASRDGVKEGSVKFHYSTNGGENFSSAEMKPESKAESSGAEEYSAVIEGMQPGSGLYYYFTAEDAAGISHQSPRRRSE